MTVLKALETPEYIYTKDGRRRATHEIFGYAVKPFGIPPVTVTVSKGFIDTKGQFHLIQDSQKSVDLTLEEFKTLLNPSPQGKRALDFRLSDILDLARVRLYGGFKAKVNGEAKDADAKAKADGEDSSPKEKIIPAAVERFHDGSSLDGASGATDQ